MKYLALSFFLVCTAAAGLFAAGTEYTVQHITLEQALQSAYEHNHNLQQQAITLEQARKAFSNAWNTFLPAMSLSAGASNSHGSDTDASWSWSGSAGINITFTAGIPDQIKQLKLTYDTQTTTYNNLKAQLEQNVSTAFYTLIANRTNIDILKDSLALAESEYRQLRENYNRGLASELEMLKAQYAWQSIKPSVQKAESTYKTNLASFALLTGLVLPDDGTEEISGEIPVQKLTLPDTAELIGTYMHNRYDVQLQKQAVQNAELTYRIRLATGRAPSLSLSENLSLAENTLKDSVSTTGSFRISLSLPLNAFIPGSSDTLVLGTYADAVTKAEQTYENTCRSAENDIEEKTREITRLYETVELSELNRQIAGRSWQLSKEGYRAGLVSQTDAESARQSMVSANQTVLQAKIDYLSAVYSLANALQLTVDEVYTLFAADTAAL